MYYIAYKGNENILFCKKNSLILIHFRKLFNISRKGRKGAKGREIGEKYVLEHKGLWDWRIFVKFAFESTLWDGLRVDVYVRQRETFDIK